MKPKTLRYLKIFGAAAAGAWVYDVVIRPHVAAKKARRYADSVGKPLLNVGAGTKTSSVRTSLLGPTTWGDINIDIQATERECRSDNVCWGDAHDLPWPDKYFGAVIASHVLEHLEEPQRALDEWMRVADRVYVIVPSWWGLHTWLQTDHKWFISKDLNTMIPLWHYPVGRQLRG